VRFPQMKARFGDRTPEQWTRVRESVRKAVNPLGLGVLVEEKLLSWKYTDGSRELVFEFGVVTLKVFSERIAQSPTGDHAALRSRTADSLQPSSTT